MSQIYTCILHVPSPFVLRKSLQWYERTSDFIYYAIQLLTCHGFLLKSRVYIGTDERYGPVNTNTTYSLISSLLLCSLYSNALILKLHFLSGQFMLVILNIIPPSAIATIETVASFSPNDSIGHRNREREILYYQFC